MPTKPDLTKAQLQERTPLFESWVDGYLNGGPVSETVLVFFCKYVERFHPELAVSQAERDLTAIMNDILDDETYALIEENLAAYSKSNNLAIPIAWASLHGQGLRALVHKIRSGEALGGPRVN